MTDLDRLTRIAEEALEAGANSDGVTAIVVPAATVLALLDVAEAAEKHLARSDPRSRQDTRELAGALDNLSEIAP